MGRKPILLVVVSLALGLGACLWLAQRAATEGMASVGGVVIDADGPVAGATVRQQTTTISTTSLEDGTFTLDGLTEGITVTVTAWGVGYYPGGVQICPPSSGIVITLTAHPTGDNKDYEWYTSMPDPDQPIGCGHCMVAFPQWEKNAHAGSATNPRFFSLYNGTNATGTEHIGGGYKDDFPGTAGNCATCHAPGAAANYPFTADMNELTGVETEGVLCEYCHKIGAAYLDETTGLPYPNAPGVVSYELVRPPSDTHMFFGPFDDVTRRVSYLELEKQSQFCAPCHQFSFWGTPIYESFREWLESPYPDMGIECQTCHMKPTGIDHFVLLEKGGLIRRPETIASHLQPGASDLELLQNTVEMTLSARQVGDRIRVSASVTNTEAGHHVPTDFPGRHMILTIAATDGEGGPLSQVGGPTVPEWGGAQAGLPGKAYAKVLRDVASGEYPVVSYWKQALIVSDNRIPAFGTDVSTYALAAPSEAGTVSVVAELRFRRVFQDLLDVKGWDAPDIVMEEETLSLMTAGFYNVRLPILLK